MGPRSRRDAKASARPLLSHPGGRFRDIRVEYHTEGVFMESVPISAPFVGRAAELRLLGELARSERAVLLILYGRRRIGKTRLLTHWMSMQGGRALYWVAEPTSSLD